MEKPSKKLREQNIIPFFALVLIALLISYIGSVKFSRIDLTTEKRYTLSDYTKNILKNLDDKIYVKVYLDGNDLSVEFKQLRTAIEEQLEEYRIFAAKGLEIIFINPSETRDQKIRTETYRELYAKGIIPYDMTETDAEGNTVRKVIFPGAFIIYKENMRAVNFLKSNPAANAQNNINFSIQTIEYELTKEIQKLSAKKIERVAFIEGHNELNELEVIDISTSLSEYYQVERGIIGGKTGILDNFAAIIIAKPTKNFDEPDKYVIDQYIMNGGRVLWLIDGAEVYLDSLQHKESTLAMGASYNIEDQFFKYGIRINPNVLLDAQCAPIGLTNDFSDNPQIKLFPCFYFPVLTNHSKHVISRYLSTIKLNFCSTIDTVGVSEKIKKTVLLQSSNLSLIEAVPFIVNLESLKKPIGKENFVFPPQNVAVLVEGTFESVFKNRLGLSFIVDKQHFIAESKPTKMIFVADGDIAKNDFSIKGEPYPLGYDPVTKQTFTGNTEFIINAVNYLCEDEGLLSIRQRELKLRLLDKKNITENKLFWQLLNTLLPLIALIVIGLIINYIRRQKYTK